MAAENNAFGDALAADFATQWKSQGGKIGTAQLYDTNATSLHSVAASLTANKPAAWAIIAYPTSFGVLAPSLVRTGAWSQKKTLVTESLKNADVLNKIGPSQPAGLDGTAGKPYSF